MKHISELLKTADGISERIAGITSEQRTRQQSSDFAEHVRSRKFPINRLFTTDEVARACRRYGLEWDLFDGDIYNIEHPHVRLTELEQAAIDAWDDANSGSGRRVIVTIDHKGESLEVRARLKRVVRYTYVGPEASREVRKAFIERSKLIPT